jgi:hypothetical protein
VSSGPIAVPTHSSFDRTTDYAVASADVNSIRAIGVFARSGEQFVNDKFILFQRVDAKPRGWELDECRAAVLATATLFV